MAFRALGWLLLAIAVAVTVHDLLSWWSEGRFPLSGLGSLWSNLDPGSLGDARATVGLQLSGTLWNWTVRPLLSVPAAPVFLVLGVVFLWLGDRREGQRAPRRPVVGSRPPRRRRGGLS